MKAILHTALAALLLCAAAGTANAACEKQSVEQARKLLNFHVGGDDRIEIDPNVKTLPSIKNPAAPAQKFDVHEVWGSIYKGSYRMRLIYYRTGTDCLLMGQEVLELARL